MLQQGLDFPKQSVSSIHHGYPHHAYAGHYIYEPLPREAFAAGVKAIAVALNNGQLSEAQARDTITILTAAYIRGLIGESIGKYLENRFAHIVEQQIDRLQSDDKRA